MKKTFSNIGICLVIIGFFFLTLSFVKAQSSGGNSTAQSDELTQSQKDLESLKQQIADKNAEIEKVQAEIDKYKKQIEETGTQADTLKGVIKRLENTKAKLSADINLTTKKIQTTNLNIERLSIAIGDKKEMITKSLNTLENTVQKINEIEMYSPIEVILANQNLYDGWNDIEDLRKFQDSIRSQLEDLKSLKKELEDNKTQTEKEKKSLTSLKTQLSDQKKIIDQNKQQQNKLLTDTKNQEAAYKKMLADQLAKKQQLENEILDFESQLKIAVDASLLPKVGTGVLSYPVSSVRITQYFGNTPFATQNPQIYNGSGHTGVDFGVSTGSIVKSAANGVVVDTGNTDSQCYGVSYGKWVLIRHSNGLSTLYAHLSLIKVSAGESVGKGDLIGYSGNTGYSTGPHLHFAVFASQAVSISEPSGPNKFISKICGTYLKLPISPRSGYLNPLSYL